MVGRWWVRWGRLAILLRKLSKWPGETWSRMYVQIVRSKYQGISMLKSRARESLLEGCTALEKQTHEIWDCCSWECKIGGENFLWSRRHWEYWSLTCCDLEIYSAQIIKLGVSLSPLVVHCNLDYNLVPHYSYGNYHVQPDLLPQPVPDASLLVKWRGRNIPPTRRKDRPEMLAGLQSKVVKVASNRF